MLPLRECTTVRADPIFDKANPADDKTKTDLSASSAPNQNQDAKLPQQHDR